jgi:RimJ/RimL family protein N-acetyltransferase
MRNGQRIILSGLSYLFRGEFFLLAQALVTRLLPARFCRMKKSIFYRLQTERPPQNARGLVTESLEIIHGTESSVQSIVRDLYAPEELAFYEEYYRKGIEPWAAQLQGKVIGVIWLYTGSYLAMWEGYDAWLLNVQVEPNGKFFANVFTDPASRGKGVFSFVAEQCFAAYPESPFYTCIEASNKPSIRSHEKVGFRQCAVACSIRFFQTTFCYFVTQTGKRRFFRIPKGQAVPISLKDSK